MAIQAIDSVPVLTDGLTMLAVSVEPKTKRERDDAGAWHEYPVFRDGVQGTVVETLVSNGDSVMRSAKVSIYGPVPTIPPLAPVTFTGLRAAAWASNGKSGLWFEADAVALASSSASGSKRAGGDA